MSTITTITGSDVVSTSRTDINTNFSNLNTDKIETSVLDTDTTLAANSDAKIPSQKAVKAYVDGVGTATATTLTKGIVEIATQAEVDDGTATGGTGASLVVTPDLIKGSKIPIVRTYLNAGSPATWTKPTGLKYVIVEVQAGGGAGGAGNDGANQHGAGGGGGGYSKKLIAVATLGAMETVTTGAGGASSSFGAHATATAGGAASGSATAGTGGVGSSGDLNLTGNPGSYGTDADISMQQSGGNGGSSFLGGGGAGKSSGAGTAGSLYGGGGGGGGESGAGAGGAGAAGIVIVTEYYS